MALQDLIDESHARRKVLEGQASTAIYEAVDAIVAMRPDDSALRDVAAVALARAIGVGIRIHAELTPHSLGVF